MFFFCKKKKKNLQSCLSYLNMLIFPDLVLNVTEINSSLYQCILSITQTMKFNEFCCHKTKHVFFVEFIYVKIVFRHLNVVFGKCTH